jgi:moderate conductance mechanosensitive channel
MQALFLSEEFIPMKHIEAQFEDWSSKLIPWFLHHGLKIILIVFLAYLANKLLQKVIEKAVRIAVVADPFTSSDAEKKREDTLISIFSATLRIVFIIIVSMMALQELGVEIGPLLAGAGIVGLALGFGGQYLIRDLISGLFIILENQYRIGDVVSFDNTGGLVEEITLRMTTIRDQDGTVHHIPHGEIKKVSNLSKTFSRVNLNIGISYDCDLEKVIALVNQIGAEMAADDLWKDTIIKAPQFLRVNDLGESSIIIKILGETTPLHQWEVTGELRKRILITFRQNGIEIPFPQTVVHLADKKKEERF